MNKKRIAYLLALLFTVSVFLGLWLYFSFRNHKTENMQENNISNIISIPTAREASDWNEPLLEEIKVEFIETDELKKMGLESNPRIKLQILERDVNGKVSAYKKVYKEDDIVRYVYKKDFDNLGSVSTSTTNIGATTSTSTR